GERDGLRRQSDGEGPYHLGGGGVIRVPRLIGANGAGPRGLDHHARAIDAAGGGAGRQDHRVSRAAAGDGHREGRVGGQLVGDGGEVDRLGGLGHGDRGGGSRRGGIAIAPRLIGGDGAGARPMGRERAA